MQRQNKNAAGEYSRGWEVVGHFLNLLRLSIVRHALVALMVGIILGTAHFCGGLSPEARADWHTYVKAEARASISEAYATAYTVRGKTATLPNGQVRDWLRHQVFGGRSLGFLFQQWCSRVFGWALVAAPLVGGIMQRYGRKAVKERRIRGAVLEDPQAQRKEAERRRRVNCFAGGTLAATVILGGVLGARCTTIPEYAAAAMATSFPPFAAFLSPNGGQSAWYGAPLDPGFYANTAAYEYLRRELFGMSFAALVLCYALLSLGLSGGAYALVVWRKGRKVQPTALMIANVATDPRKEPYNFTFCGTPGSGKSEAIKQVFRQVRARNEPGIIYDNSGEYIEAFYDPKRGDIILNPHDVRSAIWSIWAEARTPADLQTMAKSLFPQSPGTDIFWSEAGAALFADVAGALLEKDVPPTNAAFYAHMTSSTLEELRKLLGKRPAARLLDPDAGEMPSNLLATVAAKIAPWAFLPDVQGVAKPFSIRSFVEQQKPGRCLFLAGREDQLELLRPLISLWYDIAATAILTLPEDPNRRIWSFIDEAPTLQRLPALPKLLSRGRKYGAPVVLGIQSMPQLRETYGNDGAESLMSMTQTKLVLRTDEPKTAKWLEETLGNLEFEESRESKSMGVGGGDSGLSLQQNILQRPVVMAAEIARLPDMQGYLKRPGDLPVVKVKYTYVGSITRS